MALPPVSAVISAKVLGTYKQKAHQLHMFSYMFCSAWVSSGSCYGRCASRASQVSSCEAHEDKPTWVALAYASNTMHLKTIYYIVHFRL